jgi:thiol-disulfide isomerase/thioredoxin
MEGCPMNLEKWFEKGITAEQYVKQMDVNKENLLSIYNHFTIPEGEEAFINGLKEKNLRVIVLTEDWCGDSMLNVPILLKLAEAADMEVRFLYRDENLELMDQYLTNGTTRSIPIFIFLNQDGEEVAVWGPRAKEIQQLVIEKRSALPPMDHPDFEEKQNEMNQQLKNSYLETEEYWYEVFDSLKTRLAERLF